MKFGLLIDKDILKRATSSNAKPEVKLRRNGRHLENRYNIIIFDEEGPIWMKFGSVMQNDMPSMVILSKSKPEV